ncbi:MAG: hypothetical protein JWO04_3001, partial [Gammaproteobacteria bacterium]|nr:hypothetical protein [Gammaproteobacteria bacterium]
MLIRIVRINHVGLFRAGVVTVPQLQRVTAFYGENGRGKSTLSAILDSCSRGKASLVHCRATIDEENPTPHVELIFDGGAGGNVQFAAGAWTVARPDMLVFDSQFVHDNAYTGLEVTSDNRKALYEFALGDQATVLRQLDALQLQAQEELRQRQVREEALRTNLGPYNIADFVALVPDPNIEEALHTARQRVIANRDSAQVQARQDLVPLTLPGEFSLSATVAQLNRATEQLNQDALTLVRDHFGRHPERGLEEWVNRGRAFDVDLDCPFCGQNTQHNGLIGAYGQYFSEGFQQLRGAVLVRFEQMRAHLGEPSLEALRATVIANASRQGAWIDLQPTDPIAFDVDEATSEVRALRMTFEGLYDEKRTHLLASVVDDPTHAGMDRLHTSFTARIARYNLEVQRINGLFAARRAEVAAGDPNALARQVQLLEALARRGTVPVMEAVRGYVNANNAYIAASNARTTLRQQHDGAMATMLEQYQDRINVRLREFRAGFSIEGFGPSHAAGQTPRATFRIALRGEYITELQHDENEPSFPTALSDGDRRTLALAFFLARLDLDLNLAQKILVFDDPMASFDRNRKDATIRIVAELAGRCNQVIVLSHDAYFLHEIETRMRMSATAFAAHKIGYGANDDAVFTTCDLGGECSSEYMRNYALLAGYLAGAQNTNARPVAGALRILVEEFYKVRYPTEFTLTMTLGGFIDAIRAALAGSPLANFAANVDALERFNVFARRFHHSNPNAQNEPLNEHELRQF